MKNNGFTLIELLAVIVIIGIVATITTPIITSAIATSREKACERQEEMVLDAAKRWETDHVNDIDDGVTIKQLIADGYLNNKSLKNPKTNTEIDKESKVIILYDDNNHQYTYTYNLCVNAKE